MSSFEQVLEFNTQINDLRPSNTTLFNRFNLIKEEVNELEEALHFFNDAGELYSGSKSFTNLAKELADVLITVYGLAGALSINADRLVELVMKSNNTKLIEPEFDETGKLLKGKHYQAPDLKRDMAYYYEGNNG